MFRFICNSYWFDKISKKIKYVIHNEKNIFKYDVKDTKQPLNSFYDVLNGIHNPHFTKNENRPMSQDNMTENPT